MVSPSKDRRAEKRRYYLANKEYMNKRNKAYNRKIRSLVLDHYGRLCKCCGETTEEFLAIDHIEGGGRKHKRENGWYCLTAWLWKHKFPEGFQTLCHNCNQAKVYGVCPHQRT